MLVFYCYFDKLVSILFRDGSAKMIYTIMSTDNGDTVAVEDDVLISGSNPGQAALHITAQEEFGINQTLVILVKVRTLEHSYLIISFF